MDNLLLELVVEQLDEEYLPGFRSRGDGSQDRPDLGDGSQDHPGLGGGFGD